MPPLRPQQTHIPCTILPPSFPLSPFLSCFPSSSLSLPLFSLFSFHSPSSSPPKKCGNYSLQINASLTLGITFWRVAFFSLFFPLSSFFIYLKLFILLFFFTHYFFEIILFSALFVISCVLTPPHLHHLIFWAYKRSREFFLLPLLSSSLFPFVLFFGLILFYCFFYTHFFLISFLSSALFVISWHHHMCITCLFGHRNVPHSHFLLPLPFSLPFSLFFPLYFTLFTLFFNALFCFLQY